MKNKVNRAFMAKKRIFFMVIGTMAAMSLSAQMTVWSNGQSVYNRSVESVDSISFGSATQAGVIERAESGQAVTSFAGKIYLYHLPNSTSAASTDGIAPWGLVFYSDSEGYIIQNTQTDPIRNYNAGNPFTYTIIGNEVVLTTSAGSYAAKIIGSKALFFYGNREYGNGNGLANDKITNGCYFNWEP